MRKLVLRRVNRKIIRNICHNHFPKHFLLNKRNHRSSLLTVTNKGVITMQRAGIYGADQVVDILMETDVYGEPLTYEGAVKTLRRNNLP